MLHDDAAIVDTLFASVTPLYTIWLIFYDIIKHFIGIIKNYFHAPVHQQCKCLISVAGQEELL